MSGVYFPISITANTTLDRDLHANGPVLSFGAAAGSTITLPASTGKGDRYRFFVGVTVTSNNDKIQVANSTDVMSGMIFSAVTTTAAPWQTTGTSDTITLNGTTTGGIKGDYIELEDVAAGVWRVLGHTLSTGTQATPFSAAV